MKVTKQQKILGGLMLAGLVLVGADQCGMLPGSSAPREEPTSEYALPQATVSAAKAPAPVAASLTTASGKQASVAQRLRETAKSLPDNQVRDVFAIGPGWVAPVPEAAKLDPAAQAERFKQSHKLTGVLSSRDRDHAVVDNKIVTIGQSVDGFKLVSVSHRSATFEAGESRIELKMGAPGPAAVAGAQ